MLSLIILVLLATVLYFYLTWNNGYWKERGVPHDEPTLLFGSFKEVIFQPKHYGLMYHDMYRKYKQYPYCGYFKLTTPGVIINDLDLMKKIMLKDFAHFADNDLQINTSLDTLWSKNPFIDTGETWKKTRSAWTYSLTTSKIKAMFEFILKKCDSMMEYIDEHNRNSDHQALEGKDLFTKLFNDNIVGTIFGIQVDSFKNPNNPFYKISKNLFCPNFWEAFMTLLILIAPKVGKILRLRFIPKQMVNDLMELGKSIKKIKEQQGFNSNSPMDAILLQNDKEITEEEIASIVLGFLLDGSETSSGVAGYIMLALAEHPDVQQRLRSEIDEAYENKSGKITYDVVHQLPYLDMIFSETLRLNPPLLSFHRICTKPYDLPPIHPGDKPVQIPVGMTVVIPVYGLHHDAEYFPEPQKFDPERFNSENKPNIKKFSYLPFGDGPRICLGSRLAMNNIKISVVSLIRNYEVRMSDKMTGKALDIYPNILVMRNSIGLWVTFHRRH